MWKEICQTKALNAGCFHTNLLRSQSSITGLNLNYIDLFICSLKKQSRLGELVNVDIGSIVS